MPDYNQMQLIKRHFFAMRNGVIADTLRKSRLDYKIIFGLNLPQLAEQAATLPHTPELAEELWADCRTRESLLLAPMLYPPEMMDEATARRWFASAPTTEVADVLCHRLLRKLPCAYAMAMDHIADPDDLRRYTAFRLLFNIVGSCASQIKPFVEAELAAGNPLTKRLCANLLDEIEFITDTAQ